LNPKTVGTYKIRAMKKLGLKNNAQLFQYMAQVRLPPVTGARWTRTLPVPPWGGLRSSFISCY
jgi:Response regulator containing a CheY-like receiver domain and an HTH DNA-binding domain